MRDRAKSSDQRKGYKRILGLTAILVFGLALSEVSFLSSFKGPNSFGMSIAWAWGYLALVWGAAFVVLLISTGLARTLPLASMTKEYFEGFCRLAFVSHDFSGKRILAQLLVSSLLNALVLFIVFLPA